MENTQGDHKNNQLCSNDIYITTSANQERDVPAVNDKKRWGSESSLGSVSYC